MLHDAVLIIAVMTLGFAAGVVVGVITSVFAQPSPHDVDRFLRHVVQDELRRARRDKEG